MSESISANWSDVKCALTAIFGISRKPLVSLATHLESLLQIQDAG